MKHLKLIFAFTLILAINITESSDRPDKVNKNVKVFLSKSLYEVVACDLGELSNLYDNEKFDRNLPTAIYIHGYQDEGDYDFSAMAIRAAYRERNDHNFITIDWKSYSKSYFYGTIVIPQLQIICETIAQNLLNLIKKGYEVDKLHLIGHSLGGQCIGHVSRHLKKLSNNNFVIPRLYALDPAGPGFENGNILSKILKWNPFKGKAFPMVSREDAKYVQIIHTSAGSYGIVESRGHADFFPNAGVHQYGCELEFLSDVCSHRRSWLYYQESVKNPSSFSALKCESFSVFQSGNCKGNEQVFMGFSNDTSARGNFYLITHSNPYQTSLGINGIEFEMLHVIKNTSIELRDRAMVNFKIDQVTGSGSETAHICSLITALTVAVFIISF